jgi:hypothetical protein
MTSHIKGVKQLLVAYRAGGASMPHLGHRSGIRRFPYALDRDFAY